MKKIYRDVCNKYNKFKSPKISHILEKTLGPSVVYSKCGHGCKKIFDEKDSIEILKILGVVTNTRAYQKIYNHV